MFAINRIVILLLVLMAVSPAANSAAASPMKLAVLGDSLSAGFQLAPGEGFTDQLQAALDRRGHNIEVINAAVSGDTTSGGLSRLDWSIGSDVKAVIVALGANDALRGLPPETTRTNMFQIVGRLRERGAEVLIAGMLAPRNLGDEYALAFDPIFAETARAHDALHYPFFLEGVAFDAALNLQDGMHPNAQGIAVMVENILPFVERLIAKADPS